MSDNPILSIVGPLGEAVAEILKLPMQIVQQPDVQNQIKDIPEIIRLNANYFVQNIREGPANLQKMLEQAPKAPPSPLPNQQKIEDPISIFLKSINQK